MTSDLMPYGCDLPMWHSVQSEGYKELHVWSVAGLAGTMTLSAVCVPTGLPTTIAATDENGASWLGRHIVFHGVSPVFGHQYFPDCGIRHGDCWSDDFFTLHAMHLIERIVSSRQDMNLQIHRMLSAEYHMYVGERWLDWLDPVGALSW